MKEYTLYLDESGNEDFFIISGFIIENSNCQNLETKIDGIRKIIWDESYIQTNNPILHATELNNTFENRNNSKFRTSRKEYMNLHSKGKDEIKSVYEKVYQELCLIFKNVSITCIGVIIDNKLLEDMYPANNSLINNKFHMGMETIIDNYLHFLRNNDGYGSIVYESRNSTNSFGANTPDNVMFKNFCSIKSTNKGIRYVSQNITDRHLSNIQFQQKTGDNLAIAFADFVSYNILMRQKRNSGTYSEFMKKIYENTYNGNKDVTYKDYRMHFGVKKIPVNYDEIQKIINENRKLKKEFSEQKKSIKKLYSLNKQLKEEKLRLRNKENNENIR